MPKYLLVFLFLTGSLHIICKTPPTINKESIHQQCIELLKDPRNLHIEEIPSDLVFLNDSVAYFNPVGTLHVFKILFDSVPHVSLIRDSKFNGHNFTRYLFLYKDDLYSFGGYGMFRHTTSLIKFDPSSKEWFEVSVSNLPTKIERVNHSWQGENKLYVLYKISSERNEYSFGYIHLDSNNYEELSHFMTNEPLKPIIKKVYQTTNSFILLKYEIQNSKDLGLMSTKDGTYTQLGFIHNGGNADIADESIYTIDSMIYKRNADGSIDSVHFKNSPVLQRINYIEHYKSLGNQDSFSTMSAIGVFVILLIIGVALYLRKSLVKPEKECSNPEECEFEKIVQLLFEYRGKLITSQELSEILGITENSADSIKSIRSQFIKRITEDGRIQIERRRNPTDRRYFDYYIE